MKSQTILIAIVAAAGLLAGCASTGPYDNLADRGYFGPDYGVDQFGNRRDYDGGYFGNGPGFNFSAREDRNEAPDTDYYLDWRYRNGNSVGAE